MGIITAIIIAVTSLTSTTTTPTTNAPCVIITDPTGVH
jgi:hypothetical protein